MVFKMLCFFLGLSQVVTDILYITGMFGAGSHEFLIDTRASSIPVHTVLDIGGSYSFRCEPESVYRSVQAMGHAAVVKLHSFLQNINVYLRKC